MVIKLEEKQTEFFTTERNKLIVRQKDSYPKNEHRINNIKATG